MVKHGGLTRSGKVKNQTPTVETYTDKPKKKTGRAKKRQICSRRLRSDGRSNFNKIGPNSNTNNQS